MTHKIIIVGWLDRVAKTSDSVDSILTLAYPYYVSCTGK